MAKLDKYTFFGILTKTLQLCDNIFKQWRILLAYAFFITLCCMLFGRWNFSCKNGENFWCFGYFNNKYVFFSAVFANILFSGFLFLSFINSFYEATFENKIFKLKNIFLLNNIKIKRMLMILAYVATILLPLIVAGYIFIKAPNPNWKIEAVYFVIMFFCVFISVLTIRFLSFLSFFFENNKFPNLKTIAEVTSGHAFSSIILFLSIFMLINLVYMDVFRILNHFTNKFDNFAATILSEYIDSFAKLFLLGVIITLSKAEQIIQNIIISKKIEN